MSRIRWSVIPRWFVLLFSAAILSAALCRPSAAQQYAQDYEAAYLEDGGDDSCYLEGYAQMEVSSDYADMDAYAEVDMDYDGWLNWYGVCLEGTIYSDGAEIDSDFETDDGIFNSAFVEFYESPLSGKIYDFLADYEVYYLDSCDPGNWGDYCETLDWGTSYLELAAQATAQIQGVDPQQATVNANTAPTSATFTVTVNHSDSSTFPYAYVDVNIITYTQSPSGNAISYTAPTTKTISIKGSAGYSQTQFKVNGIPGTTVNGSVGAAVWLSNPQPSGGVVILDPDPASNAQITVNTTSN